MNPVAEALWDSDARVKESGWEAGCLEGTRVEVLEGIYSWSDEPSGSLYLLSGTAGTGKSSIVHTVCEDYSKRGRLGASFFFSRSQEVRSKAEPLIRTLAYQLSHTLPLRAAISEALEDKTLLRASPIRQLRELIVRPLETLQKSHPLPSAILIVIDALDECEGGDGSASIFHFIPVLAKNLAQSSAPLKVLLTSRPNAILARAFSEQSRQSGSLKLLTLHKVEPSIVNRDIHLYIAHKLNAFAEEHGVDGWPSNRDVVALVELSGGLFISAVTLLRLLEFDIVATKSNPREALLTLLGNNPPRLGLDGSYQEVLRKIHLCNPSTSPKAQMQLHEIRALLAFLVLSFDPLPEPSIDTLLGIQCALHFPILRSVFEIRDHRPLKAIHTSFCDFITDLNRCKDDVLHVTPSVCHRDLARLCLEKLNSTLKRNFLDVKGSHIMNSDVKGRVSDIPMDVCYAAKYGIEHLLRCTLSDELRTLLERFLADKILYWIEILSYLQYLKEGLATLKRLSNAINASIPLHTLSPSHMLAESRLHFGSSDQRLLSASKGALRCDIPISNAHLLLCIAISASR